MILNSITLENIRSFKNATISLDRGVTLFQGDIGTGKSSILMAIEFALFGVGTSLDALLKTNTHSGSVTLDFEVDGITHSVKRILKRTAKSVKQVAGTITTGNVQEELSASELKPRILSILRFNESPSARSHSRIYRYAVFTPQEEMKTVLWDPNVRLETLRKAFGIEDYQIASKNAKTVADFIKTKMLQAQMGFKNLDGIVEELSDNAKEIAEAEKKLSEQREEKETLDNEQKAVDIEMETLQKQDSDRRQLESDIRVLANDVRNKNSHLEGVIAQIKSENAEIARKQKEITGYEQIRMPTSKGLDQIEAEIADARENKNRLIGLEAEAESLRSQIQDLSESCDIHAKKEDLEEKIRKIDENVKKTEAELAQLVERREENQGIKTKLELDNENIKKNLDELVKIGAQCPVCENAIEERYASDLVQRRRTKIDENNQKLEEAARVLHNIADVYKGLMLEIEKLEKERTDAEKQIPILQDINAKRGELEGKKKEIEELRESDAVISDDEYRDFAAREFSDRESHLRELQNKLVKYQNMQKDIARLQDEITKKEAKIKDDTLTKNNLGFDIRKAEKEHSEKIAELEQFYGIAQKIQTTHQKMRLVGDKKMKLERESGATATHLKSLHNTKDRLTRERDTAQQYKDKYTKLSNYHSWMTDFFITTMGVIEKQVMISIQQNFNEIYQKWFSKMIEDPTKSSRIDEDFTPLVEQDGVELPTDYFSGGEKTSVALAYRLTLNTLMRQETDSLKSNLLILDEPTDGFSRAQLDKIGQIFREIDSQQIILVSHEQELESFADNTFRVTKEVGMSYVSKVAN